MRRMIPIRELFGVGALTSANTDAKDDDRVTSVPLQSGRLNRSWHRVISVHYHPHLNAPSN
jgi:hypothetical protein